MPNPILTVAIDRLSNQADLESSDAARVLTEIIDGNASVAQAAAFLIALRTKGETTGEIAGLARVLRERAVKVNAGDDLVDTAGTGGGRPTFNVSTTAAFIAAGAGCRVAKHGNRSATSQCGSADVLEALGELGAERALVVSSADGLDEFSVSGATRVVELKDGALSTYDVTPEDAGLEPSAEGAVGAGTPEQNAIVLHEVLAGNPGTERSLAVLNAGAAIYVAGRAD